VVAKPAIAAAVIVKDGRVLLVRRRFAEGSLSWQLPAGKIKPGERAPDAAVRETLEETGLTVAARLIFGDRIHPTTKRQMFYVACDVATGNAHVADAEEIAEVRWCGARELPSRVPHGFFGPVQEHLDSILAD
jgi:8-oxo-dGTP diphosphatase